MAYIPRITNSRPKKAMYPKDKNSCLEARFAATVESE
jgi:hypothetical protein